MALPPQFLDELRARLPLSDIVGRRVRLTRAGREFKGLCPFHREKSPSFTVNDQKGFFHCFGCGAHGDVVGFVMQHDHLGFLETVEQLAGQAGLQVPQATEEERERFARRTSLHEAVEAACAFFEAQLAEPDGRRALDYLGGRGVDAEAVAQFRLGYAPADGKALLRALQTKGFSPETLVEAGLARQPDDGRPPFGFFRDRLIFPVADRRGRVVAFGGRILDGDGPKYLNSPDTPLFQKGQLLYGLSRARAAAGQGHTVVVAEGYMDVIALAQAGFQAAVAPLGTAVTEAQVQELWRLCQVPVLCFDGDAAGQRAAWRAVERVMPLLKPDHSARVAFLPTGEDPDSLLRSGGAAAMRRVLENALPLTDVLWQAEAGRHRLDTPEGRAGLKAALDQVADGIGDRAVQDFYRKDIRARLDAAFPWRPPTAAGGGQGARAGRVAQGPQPRRASLDRVTGPLVLLAALINHPSLFDRFGEAFAHLDMADTALDGLRRDAIGALTQDSGLDTDTLRLHLSQVGHAAALTRVLSPQTYARAPFASPTVTVEQAAEGWYEVWRRLDVQRVRGDLRMAGEALGEALTEGNLARVRALKQQALLGEDETNRSGA